MKVVSSAQMRAIEARLFDQYHVPSPLVMEVAGRQVATVARRLLEQNPGPVAVVCGKGKNGGDGYVAARWLHHWGIPVQVIAWAAPDEMPAEAADACQAARSFGVSTLALNEAPIALQRAALIIDAVLGTGVTGPARGMAAEAIRLINLAGRPVLAIDMPSGVATETGRVEGGAVHATWTVTCGLPKLGLFQFPAAAYLGKLIVADIGLPSAAIDAEDLSVELTSPSDIRAWLPSYGQTAHKGTRGRALIAAASRGMTGAAALAGESALRAGAGLVTVAAPASAQPVVASLRPEFTTLPLPESESGGFASFAADDFLREAARADALGIGPGLGNDPEVTAFVRRVVEGAPAPLVIDADAIRAFGGEPTLIADAPVPVVLTPHPGEMAYLLGLDVEAVQADRFAAVRAAALATKAVVLLKGAFTLIAEPDGSVWINPTGNRALGTGGSGDVLTGLIAGLLAQGMGTIEAAVAGAYMHGLAGERLSQLHGPDGILAGDLPGELPRIQRDLRQGLPDSIEQVW